MSRIGLPESTLSREWVLCFCGSILKQISKSPGSSPPRLQGRHAFGNGNGTSGILGPPLQPAQLAAEAVDLPGSWVCVHTNLTGATQSIFFLYFKLNNSVIQEYTHSCNKCAPSDCQPCLELRTQQRGELTLVPALGS